MRLTGSITRKVLPLTGYVLATLIVIDVVLFFYLKRDITGAGDVSQHVHHLQALTTQLKTNAAAIDRLAGNSMATRHSETVNEYEEALQSLSGNIDSLRYAIRRYQVALEMLGPIDGRLGEVMTSHRGFLNALQEGDSLGTVNKFRTLPSVYAVSDEIVNSQSISQADESSASAFSLHVLTVVAVVQILLLIGVPALVLTAIALRMYTNKLVAINRAIDDSNRKYVFDSKEPVDLDSEEAVKNSLMANLKKASDFIQRVAEGDYSVRWEGMNDQNREFNRENIAGELIRMREQMKQVKEQDRSRIWATEGLSTFGEIIRKHQDNFDLLAESVTTNLVKYLNAKVGGLFIVEEREDASKVLQLRACYAYDRKKFLTREIEPGEGLIGQTYLEGKTIYLTQVPEKYMHITSGLGEATPRSLLVVPLKANDRIEGVLELASLTEFKPHEIEFLEKLAETLASSIVSVKGAEKTKDLLLVSQEQSEEMRAQEEEMRQNMEELEATQEQMSRQMNELNALKESLEKEKNLFGALMDNIPDAIYFKDRESKFLRVSKYLADHFNASVDELIGKSDFDFQDEVHANEAFEDEKNIMKTRKAKIDFVEKETLADGSDHWVSTTKMPLINAKGEVIGTFGISRDVSRLKRLELDVTNRDKKLREEEEQFARRIKQLEEEVEAKEAEIKKLKKK